MSQKADRVVHLSGIEFLTLAMCAAEVATRHEQAGDLPAETIKALDTLGGKCVDIAQAVRGGSIEFGLTTAQPGEEVIPANKLTLVPMPADTTVAPKTEVEEVLDVMAEHPSGTVLS